MVSHSLVMRAVRCEPVHDPPRYLYSSFVSTAQFGRSGAWHASSEVKPLTTALQVR